MLLEHTPRKLDIFDHIVLDFVDPIVEVLGKGFSIFVEQFEELVMVNESFVYFLLEEMAVKKIVFPVFGEDNAIAILINEPSDDLSVLLQ